MNGEIRRRKIIEKLLHSDKPIPGVELAKAFEVSRQVIVQDIALIRANGEEILSTNRGYILQSIRGACRVFKVKHEDEDVERELNAIVDMGGQVKDVFVYHKIYGTISAPLNVKSRMDVENYMKDMGSGNSSLLKNVTSGYHYHTVYAESEELLNLIQLKLKELGFLARLQDYEPVDFWK